MLSVFWNERYSERDYAYGLTPNLFLKEQLPNLKRGSILFPCEGEGRNAVYACEQAWTTYAFDYSEQGRRKAMALASQRFINFQYDIFEVENYSYDIQFDAAGIFFAHFPEENQVDYYQKIASSIKEGGVLLGELFAEEQLVYQDAHNSGGPKDISMLMSIEKMKNLFPTIDFEILQEQEVELNEGAYHQGKARTIQFLGGKTNTL